MKTTILSFVGAASFAGQVPAQLAQTLTTDPLAPGKLIYVPYPGSTSSVAAPIAVPTLVYNCYNMPLICENVASWAKSVHPSGNGDLGQTQRLYFDPDDKHKDRRRGAACGCFHHDGCSTAVSNGKQAGVSVQTIARGGGNANALFDISWPNFKIILAGANPPRNPTTGQPTTPRLHLTSVPGRFFAEGVAFSCDEFPAATFINGGTNAKTSCALQSWQIFSGADVESINNPGTWPNTGKWPLPPGSGIRMEQDWQAQSHVYLRSAFGIGGKAQKQGWGTVYPFSFTTTTLQEVATKAYVVNMVLVTQVVNKRDDRPTTTTFYASTTTVVSGNLEVGGSSRTERRMDTNFEPKSAKVRASQPDQMRQSTRCFSSGMIFPCSIAVTNDSTYTNSLSTPHPVLLSALSNQANLSSNSPSSASISSLSESSANSRLMIPDLLSFTSSAPSSISPSSSIFAIPNSSLAGSNISRSIAPQFTSSSRSSQQIAVGSSSAISSVMSATGNFTSIAVSSIVPQPGLGSVSRLNSSLTSAIMSPLDASEPALLGNSSHPPGTSSPSSANDLPLPATTSYPYRSSTWLLQRTPPYYSTGFLTSARFSSRPTSTISLSATTSSTGVEMIAPLIPVDSSPSMTSQASTSSLGSAEAAYSASAVSSNVAVASGYAIVLKADSSNKSKARAAQRATHHSLNLALDLFHRSHGGSPFGRALSALISTLIKASSVADAAVDASTPDDEEKDAEELVSDLEDAAQDAGEVKEEEDDDDDDETTITSTTSTINTTTTSENAHTGNVIPSRSPTSASFSSSSLSSSMTYAPTAGPSICILTFDILGDEDLEVGDDGYDPSTGDYVGCVPVIGAGGVTSGCGMRQPATAGLNPLLATSPSGLGTISTSMTLTNLVVGPILTPYAQSSQVPATTASTQTPLTCTTDGASGMSPTSWCNCGTAMYTTTPNCVFTDLPFNPLTPATATSLPTNIPGLNGLLFCLLYTATDPGYAAGTGGYCVCNGTLAPLLTRNISNSVVSATTDCSYALQPTNTLWVPSYTTNSNIILSTPTTLITVVALTTPDYQVTTVLVLITTLLPPPDRQTIYTTVYVDPPPPPSPTTTPSTSFTVQLTVITCINDFSNVDESLCWANCFGGTCDANTNPFLNSEPWYVCSGCL